MAIIHAPWTEEQVKNLNDWQRTGFVHPFTCGGRDCQCDLVATKDGWICPIGCGYKQSYAHDFMLDGSHIRAMNSFGKDGFEDKEKT